jgi:AAA+ superfamily predicted ATPase
VADDASGGDPGPAWFRFGRALLAAAASPTLPDPALPDPAPTAATDTATPFESALVTVDDVDAARRDLDVSLSSDEPFAVLVANAQLDGEEAEVLALLATAEIDANCRRLVAAIHGDARAGNLTLGTLAVVLPVGHRGALTVAHTARLRRTGFVEVGGNGPWTDRVVGLDEALIWTLLGDESPDPNLPVGIELLDLDAELPAVEGPDGVSTLVVVTGADRMRRRQAAVSHAVGQRFLCCDVPTSESEWSALVREATITGRGVVLEVGDSLDAPTRRWLARSSHLVWALSTPSAPPIEHLPARPWTEVHASSDDPNDEEWLATFGPGVERTHRLTFDQMHRVQRARQAVGGDVDAAVRRLASGPLEQLTRRISPTRTWDDIVLSPDRKALLHTVVDRYRHATDVYDTWGFSPNPSRGLVALFSGPSGTGKTLASEIIAGELGLDVFKLDLSSVVSKYIGETEKNLEQIFDAASAGNMVLFFDEADSLFGKRSEVKDARDRYANIEVSYLLQRLEAYDGLVVLATNFEKNVDEAFLRRIHVRVEFAMPGVDERRAIWLANLPASAPVVDLDLDWLAEQFELSGASIRNAAIHAAFAAAASDSDITMDHAVLGVAHELRKMGRLLKDKDFGSYHALVTD